MGVELTAHWLADHFQATLRSTPTEQEMQEAIDTRLTWQVGIWREVPRR